MQNLTLRATKHQLAFIASVAGALAVAALAILLGRYVAGVSGLEVLVPYGLAAAAGALILGWAGVRYAGAFTECDDSAIRSRGVGREWRCSWQYVGDIAIRAGARNPALRTVVVRTTAGDQLQLGVPVTGGVMPDADFDAKVERIHEYWRSAMGLPDPAGNAIPVIRPSRWSAYTTPVTVRAAVRTSVAALLLAALIVLLVVLSASGPALLVRLGQGEAGSYTATASVCQATCFWVGEFQPGHGAPPRAAMVMAPGAGITLTGQRVAAVYPGSGALVYPPGAGTGWIPLAVPLLVIICCLPPTVGWLARWRHSRSAVQDYQPAAIPLARGHTVTSARVGLILGIEVVALVFGGTAAGYQASLIPRLSPPALACASYTAWALAQPGTGPPGADPALLADAAMDEPSGQLGADLATLRTDVASLSGESSSNLALGPWAIVVTDMKAVDRDCRP